MDIGVEQINQWHSKRPDYVASSNGLYCGYHWVIRRNGTMEAGRLESDIGAHCKGQNHDSIGICLVGRGEYTIEQWKSLMWLLCQKLDHYDLEPKQVFGHCEFTTLKSCPMFESMDKFREELEIKYYNGGKPHEISKT